MVGISKVTPLNSFSGVTPLYLTDQNPYCGAVPGHHGRFCSKLVLFYAAILKKIAHYGSVLVNHHKNVLKSANYGHVSCDMSHVHGNGCVADTHREADLGLHKFHYWTDLIPK